MFTYLYYNVIHINIFLNKKSLHIYLCGTLFHNIYLRYKIVQSYCIHIIKVPNLVEFLLRGIVKINIKYYKYRYYKAIQYYDVVIILLILEHR